MARTTRPSEDALLAARNQFHRVTAYWAPELLSSEPHIEKLVDEIVTAAYQADFGSTVGR